MDEFLNGEMEEAEWSWIEPHAKRDGVIVIGPELQIELVAKKIAEDNKKQVTEWVKAGTMTKPTREQLTAWAKTPKKVFVVRIVQPYVLIQEPVVH